MMLSKWFSLEEATKSATAKAAKINNNPPPEIVDNLRWFLTNFMDRVRDLFGVPISPSSVYRSEQLNKFVGGSATSDHMNGLACDFNVKGKTVRQIIGEIIRSGIPFDQLIDEYGTWVHGSLRKDKPNRGQVLIYRRNNDGSIRRTHISKTEAAKW